LSFILLPKLPFALRCGMCVLCIKIDRIFNNLKNIFVVLYFRQFFYTLLA